MIEFLQYHVGETIELGEHDFDRIVKDEFGWKGEFSSSSLRYSDDYLEEGDEGEGVS